MTGVANCMNATTPTKAHLGQIIPNSPESPVLSPEVKAAMDRIFPRSSTQFLQGALSFAENPFNSTVSAEACQETAHARNPVSNFVSPSCITTEVRISTLATTNTPMFVSAGNISASGNDSAVKISSAVVTTGSNSIIPVQKNNDPSKEVVVESESKSVGSNSIIPVYKNNDSGKEVVVESESKPVELSGKAVFKNRISKADFEIVTSCDALITEYERTARRLNCRDMSSSECHSRGESDSEDMSRPFASIAREKKKRKMRKRKTESNKEKASSCLSEHNVNPGDSSILMKKNSLGLSQNSQDISSHSYIVDSNPMKDNFYKDYGMTSEDISNISYSSAKENVQGEKKHSHQKLPKTKRQHFHIVKHIDKIRKIFLPCFVVAKDIDTLPCYNGTKMFSTADDVLPLSVRVKNLSDLCDKGYLSCRKSQMKRSYKNIFEETLSQGNSSDEFEQPRARSLRKRVKKINYVEPSEDDIVDEFCKKRSSLKLKDSSLGKSEDDSSMESKKRKKQDSSTADTSVALDGSGGKIIVSDKKTHEKGQQSNALQEVIVYPRTSLSNTIPYHAGTEGSARTDGSARTEGGYVFAHKINEHSMHMMYSRENNMNNTMVSTPPCISVLSSSTTQGSLPPYPTPVSLFSSLPLSFPPGLPAQPFVERSPSLVSTPSGAPNSAQYCVVKMNGKDVLLRLVPSGSIGAPLPAVMPKGKTMILPPGPAQIFNHPLRQMHPVTHSTQAFLRPVTSVVTTSQVNGLSQAFLRPVTSVVTTTQVNGLTQAFLKPVTSVVTSTQVNGLSPAPLQSLYGIPIMNRPVYTSANNISMPALSAMSSPHLASHLSTTGIRPISLVSSGSCISHRQVTALSASATMVTSGAAASARSIASVTLATQSLSTPMAASNTTSLLRNVIVPGPTVPNQATSDRSFRIFLPGSATGTPGQFASTGNPATNNILAHISASSVPLPQSTKGSEPELSPEQRAAKRRKLEKKYPLPPGVVIKTEPLDTHPQPVSVIPSRSLLPQNVQLLSATRTASGLQSFRIISPSLSNAISVRNLQGSSNIIYRTASVGCGQTILVPTSLGLITTTTAITTSSTISSPTISSLGTSLTVTAVSEQQITTTTAFTTTNVDTVGTNSLLLNTVPLSQSYRMASSVSSFPLYPSDATEKNSTDASTTSSSDITTSSLMRFAPPLTTPEVGSCESPVAMNGTNTLHSPLNILDKSVTCSRETAVPNGDLSRHSSIPPPGVAFLDNIRATLEELRKIIQIQESRGLNSERLEKLKELFHKQNQYYNEMQKLAEVNTPSGVASEFPESRNVGDGDGQELEQGCSVTNPFVID